MLVLTYQTTRSHNRIPRYVQYVIHQNLIALSYCGLNREHSLHARTNMYGNHGRSSYVHIAGEFSGVMRITVNTLFNYILPQSCEGKVVP
jgi:hypothetical protein